MKTIARFLTILLFMSTGGCNRGGGSKGNENSASTTSGNSVSDSQSCLSPEELAIKIAKSQANVQTNTIAKLKQLDLSNALEYAPQIKEILLDHVEQLANLEAMFVFQRQSCINNTELKTSLEKAKASIYNLINNLSTEINQILLKMGVSQNVITEILINFKDQALERVEPIVSNLVQTISSLNEQLLKAISQLPIDLNTSGLMDEPIKKALSNLGCSRHIDPTTFTKSTDPKGKYDHGIKSDLGDPIGEPFIGRNDFKDFIIFRKLGLNGEVKGYSVTIYLCVYGDVIVPGRTLNALYINEIYLGSNNAEGYDDVSFARTYIQLGAYNQYPQSSPFLNQFYPIKSD